MRAVVDVFVGTSGYSYKEWKGSFYPEDLPAAGMLSFYAKQFRTVEINNTFYRMPNAALLAKWAADVPDGFRFVLKASRQITHLKRLEGVADAVEYLCRTAEALGDKLGPLLFQLPPFLKKDVPRLEAFLALLPAGRPSAIEFRHESWFCDDVYERLRGRDVALCIADIDEDERAVPQVATASWGYLRLRRCAYEDAAIDAWIDRVRAQGWKQAYVFFKHEDEATGPKLARRFVERFGA